jgi:CDP-diglyceride synthetase
MQRISTNLTLFFKIFVPTFWIVFFGALTLSAFLMSYEYMGNMRRGTFQIFIALFFLSGVFMLYITLMRLKRVEMDSDFVYVTNYFKTFRYPYHHVEKIELSRFLFFHTANIVLRESGSFGKRLLFIPSMFRFREFLKEHPLIRDRFDLEGI